MGYASDLESIGLIGGGAQGFIKGWQDAEDRKQKKMELDSKLQTDQEARERAQVQQAIQLKQSNLAFDPTSQQVAETPLSQRQIGEQTVQAGEKGLRLKRDENGEVQDFNYDPNAPQSIGAHSKIMTAEGKLQAIQTKGAVGNKDWGKLSDALDPNKARGGNLAKVQQMINSSDRIHGLFNQFPDGNIPAAQTTELASAVAGLISGGSPQSQHQINQLVPQSAQGKASDMVAWFTGNPTGRQQQAFIQVLKESSERERNIALQQKAEAQRARLPQFEYLKESDPEKYSKILHGYGVDEEAPQGLVSGGLIGQGQGLVSGSPGTDSATAAKVQRLKELQMKAAGGQ